MWKVVVVGALGAMLAGCLSPIVQPSVDAGVTDAGAADAGAEDAEAPDAGAADAGAGDAGAADAGAGDAGAADAAGADAGAADAGAADAGAADAGAADAGAADAGAADAGAADAGAADAGAADAGAADAGAADAGSADAGSPDAGAADAGAADAGAADAGAADAGATDAGAADAGELDAGAADAGVPLRGRLWMWARIGSGPSQVYAQLPAGSPERTISAPGREVTGMAVTADGSMIAISYGGSPAELFVGPTDGGPAHLIRSAMGSIRVFAISPDSSHVAFMEGYQFVDGAMIMPTDGGQAMEATPRSTNFVFGTGSFSANARHFAWLGSTNFGLADLYVTDTVTSTRVAVTVPSEPTADIMTFAWTSETDFLFVTYNRAAQPRLHGCVVPDSCAPIPGSTGIRTLAVSADKTFAVIGRDAADAGIGYLDVFKSPFDGGAPTALATDFRFNTSASGAWRLSADGERLVCGGFANSDRAIYLMQTGAAAPLSPLLVLPNGVGAELAAFDPSSTQLIFRSNLEGYGSSNADGWGLQRIDLSSPLQQPVLMQRVDGGMMWDFVWTP